MIIHKIDDSGSLSKHSFGVTKIALNNFLSNALTNKNAFNIFIPKFLIFDLDELFFFRIENQRLEDKNTSAENFELLEAQNENALFPPGLESDG